MKEINKSPIPYLFIIFYFYPYFFPPVRDGFLYPLAVRECKQSANHWCRSVGWLYPHSGLGKMNFSALSGLTSLYNICGVDNAMVF